MGKSDASGDWLLVQELFERGEPSFVDEIRKFDDAEKLGTFASRWFADKRPEARKLLFDYLDRPLNAYRHEPLVKRMFKLAEANGDDELMGRFLVAFDRSVRRIVGRRVHYETQMVDTESEANALAAFWRNSGFAAANVWYNWQNKYHVWGSWTEPVARTPQDTNMPRGAMKQTYDFTAYDPKTNRMPMISAPDWAFTLKLDIRAHQGENRRLPEEGRKALMRRRLFTTATRNYLRRRSWRYFRKLGQRQPDRYVSGVLHALLHYRDEDVADGLALLDNWSLMHILFHFSPCLNFDDRGCRLAENHTLAELEPAPKYLKLWNMQPRAFVDLLLHARCRAVRSWSVRMVRRNLSAIATLFTLEERLTLLSDIDPDVVDLAADLLRDDPTLKDVPAGRWLQVLEDASPNAIDLVCELMERHLSPASLPLGEIVRLAMARPLPVARLGFRWLQTRTPTDESDCRLLLGVGEAQSDAIRPEMVRWATGILSQSAWFQPSWVLEWLDSRQLDVRAEAWKWFQTESRVHDDVMIWQKLMESPYDDIRIALVADLEARSRTTHARVLSRGDLDPELVRMLWASVLLNVFRGHRAKPIVVRQLLARLESRPDEMPKLLPLLAVALRSVRGPEWRSGLVAIVRLSEDDPSRVEAIRRAFPELQLS